ncbi:MAG: hypothetical protein QOJ63_2449 [Solirubrobacteraceae bacterium]|nr:hypothetical protein [Solirubrobacteraceae bacterium]
MVVDRRVRRVPDPRVNPNWQGNSGTPRPRSNTPPPPAERRPIAVDPRAYARTTTTGPQVRPPRGSGGAQQTAALAVMQVTRTAFRMWWGMTKAMMRFIWR